MADDFAWRRLAELSDTHGARLAGSENLTRAIAWAVETMKADGLENVHTERVMVPHWVRGHESAQIIDPPLHDVAVLGLGGTVATPAAGIDAEVLAVTSFDDLLARGAQARGRIVLLNVLHTNYSETVTYRTGSARAAAQQGAVAVLVRAVGPTGLRTPHTGSVQYTPGLPEIPALAIAAEDSNRIVRLIASGRRVRMRLVTSGHYEPDAESANVVGEIRGREKPDEIVLVGGHLDSWDVGTGASDDGVGCVVTWEAARLMKKLGIRPRRTVRVVLWTNEENGLKGAAAYAEKYAASASHHVFALESDSGVFSPPALGFTGSVAARTTIGNVIPLLAPLGRPAGFRRRGRRALDRRGDVPEPDPGAVAAGAGRLAHPQRLPDRAPVALLTAATAPASPPPRRSPPQSRPRRATRPRAQSARRCRPRCGG
jgi:carboxypeptidase Q